jgi:hypothetical protein
MVEKLVVRATTRRRIPPVNWRKAMNEPGLRPGEPQIVQQIRREDRCPGPPDGILEEHHDP